MHMVGHQDISVNPATGLVGVFFQPVEIEAAIFIGNKADLPVIAPLDQMQRDIGEHQARAAGHQKTTGRGCWSLAENRGLSPIIIWSFAAVSGFMTSIPSRSG